MQAREKVWTGRQGSLDRQRGGRIPRSCPRPAARRRTRTQGNFRTYGNKIPSVRKFISIRTEFSCSLLAISY